MRPCFTNQADTLYGENSVQLICGIQNLICGIEKLICGIQKLICGIQHVLYCIEKCLEQPMSCLTKSLLPTESSMIVCYNIAQVFKAVGRAMVSLK